VRRTLGAIDRMKLQIAARGMHPQQNRPESYFEEVNPFNFPSLPGAAGDISVVWRRLLLAYMRFRYYSARRLESYR